MCTECSLADENCANKMANFADSPEDSEAVTSSCISRTAITAFLLAFVAIALMFKTKMMLFYLKYVALLITYIVFGIMFVPLLALKPGSPQNAWWLMKYGEYIQLRPLGLRVKRKGCPYPDGPFVIVCNHQSTLDSPIMMHKDIWPGNCVVIMKNAMKYTGPFGLCLVLAGTIFVNRSNSASAKEMLRSAVQAIQEKKYRVWVFPEGTRRLTKEFSGEPLLPFKKGAFNLAVLAQVPIVPLVLSSQEKFFSFREHRFEPGEITATVLPPIPTEGLTLDDVPKLSEEVRLQMMRAFTNTSIMVKSIPE